MKLNQVMRQATWVAKVRVAVAQQVVIRGRE
jgi:hypothetical protein